MEISVDTSRCNAHGGCVLLAPGVFDLADDGLVIVLDHQPGEDARPAVEEAARCCPAGAIRVEG